MEAITEKRFTDFIRGFGNGSSCWRDGKMIDIYSLYKKNDNQLSLSHHLYFPQKKVNFNFWFTRLSYLSTVEFVTISMYDGNKNNEADKLKQILRTSDMTEFVNTVHDIFSTYK